MASPAKVTFRSGVTIPVGIIHVKEFRPMSGKRRKGTAEQPSARKRIFDSAAELFYRKGIRAVGVETIAAEADSTKMGLYRSFPSKDELVAEWLRDHDSRFWREWDAMAGRHPADPRKQLAAA